jgi:hypothetical protein
MGKNWEKGQLGRDGEASLQFNRTLDLGINLSPFFCSVFSGVWDLFFKSLFQ